MFSGLLFDRFTAETKPAVLFKSRRCLRARFSGSNCLACVVECQSGALIHTGKTISFDAEKCSGCLRCTAVCPNDAFTDNIDLELLLETVRTREKIVLSCQKGCQFEEKIQIPCIGFLSEPLLAAINALSSKEVILDVRPCRGCVNEHCLNVIRTRLSLITHKDQSGISPKITLVRDSKDIPGLDKGTARRLFLKKTGKIIADFSTELGGAACSMGSPESSDMKSPAKDQQALKIAREYVGDENIVKNLYHYLFWITATESCTRCPLCSGMCPTGALKRKKKDGSNHLSFTSENCSGCGLCVEFCKNNVLTLRQGVEHPHFSVANIA
jgi:ferredoxin